MTRIDILDPGSGVLRSRCSGPDDFGGCPRQEREHDALACAGSTLELVAGRRLLRLRVTASPQACPVRMFAQP